MATHKPEVWQRGPINGINTYLQPVAHALLQASEEVVCTMAHFNDSNLWLKPVGMASVGFHLQHLQGVLQRLFTYANGQQLTLKQLANLKKEGVEDNNLNSQALTFNFTNQVAAAIEQLRNTNENDLLAPRALGRAQIPTNVLGLYVHAAEHTMRHLGQLIVTVIVVSNNTGVVVI